MMNFGIIGCGVIAFTHAKALEQLREEGCILHACCDILEEKADQYAKEHQVPHVYYNYHDLLADRDVDIVCVCPRRDLHRGIGSGESHRVRETHGDYTGKNPGSHPYHRKKPHENAVHFPEEDDAGGDCSASGDCGRKTGQNLSGGGAA